MHNQKTTLLNIIKYFMSGIIILSACSSPESPKKEQKTENEKKTDTLTSRVNQWKDEKLSLFIHLGVYSSLSGKWNGEIIDGPAEEIWALSDMLCDDYEKVARDFSPDKWDPETIAELARDMEAGTIIMSAKHLDGFCLFDTETTRFNSKDFTSFDKDLIGEMADACKNANLKFGISFSLTDWHLPAALPMTNHYANPVTEAHHEVNKQQIKELLTNYGPISEIHFHAGLNTPEQSKELYNLVKEIRPKCLISNGIGNNFGDFVSTRFNQPPTHQLDVPWRFPASLHPSTLGHHAHLQREPAIENARKKVRELVRTISSGGNYSLNIAPTETGTLNKYEEETLRHISRWIKVNRKAIFGTKKSPFSDHSDFENITRKGTNLYIFLDSVPESEIIRLKGLKNKIKNARFLGSGIELKTSQKNEQIQEIEWTAPAMADPMSLPVIEAEFQNPFKKTVREAIKIQEGDTISLTQNKAIKRQSLSGTDHYTFIPSITALKWYIKSDNPLHIKLKFSTYEQERDILIRTKKSEDRIKIQGEEASLIRNPKDSIKTGNIYGSAISYGALKKTDINPNGNNRLQIARKSWKVIKDNKPGNARLLPLSTRYYYMEIESKSNQQYCFEITGNDGLQVWMNQEEVHLCGNTEINNPIKKSLILNLKEGRNVLLIKNYNRSGPHDHFNVMPKPDARWYTQTVTLPANPGLLQIKGTNNNNRYKDIDLPNLSILANQNIQEE